MSSCIKELYDYDIVKKSSKCGNISLKRNFYKNKNMSDGSDPRCIKCWNQKFLDNRERKKLY